MQHIHHGAAKQHYTHGLYNKGDVRERHVAAVMSRLISLQLLNIQQGREKRYTENSNKEGYSTQKESMVLAIQPAREKFDLIRGQACLLLLLYLSKVIFGKFQPMNDETHLDETNKDLICPRSL